MMNRLCWSVFWAGVCLPCAHAGIETKLWYDHPAINWETEALPIGNGRLGAMLFGGLSRDRIQFNEGSLWVGDEKDTGAYQAFGDVFVNFDHVTNTAPAKDYR